MSTFSYTTTTTHLRRIAAASAFAAVLAIGASAGPAVAQDQHTGGVSPNDESVDPGGPQAEGTNASRGGGLPVTGSDIAGLVALGATAVATGAGAVAISKRRTRLSA